MTSLSFTLENPSAQPAIVSVKSSMPLSQAQIEGLGRTLEYSLSITDFYMGGIVFNSSSFLYTVADKLYINISYILPKAYSPTVILSIQSFKEFTIPSTDSSIVIVDLFYSELVMVPQIRDPSYEVTKKLAETTAVMSSMNPTSTPVVSDVIGAASSIDPSGTMLRFFQTMKIMNRLIYFNINYGPRLYYFLATAEPLSGIPKENNDDLVYKSDSKNGRLGIFKISLDFKQCFFNWKITAYIISCGITYIIAYIKISRMEVGKLCLYIVYYWPKLHSALLAIVFVDYSFICPRFILHSIFLRDRVLALFFFTFILVDQLTLFDLLLNTNLWKKAVNRVVKKSTTKEYSFKNQISPELKTPEQKIKNRASPRPLPSGIYPRIESSTHIQKVSLVNSRFAKAGSQAKIPAFVAKRTVVIDYERTYLQIDISSPIFDTTCNSLSLTSDISNLILCRLSFILQNTRLSVLHCLLILGQKLPVFFVIIATVMELGRVIVLTALYLKYKHFKSFLIYLLEINQSMFMGIFFCICLWGQPMPSDFAQTVGIYLVLGFCVIEYVLIMLFLFMSCIDMVRSCLEPKPSEIASRRHLFIRYKPLLAQPGRDSSAQALTPRGSIILIPSSSAQGKKDNPSSDNRMIMSVRSVSPPALSKYKRSQRKELRQNSLKLESLRQYIPESSQMKIETMKQEKEIISNL